MSFIILDADNVVDSNFLSEVNKVIDADVQPIQTHRTAKTGIQKLPYLMVLVKKLIIPFFVVAT